jgi:hypothetical protein
MHAPIALFVYNRPKHLKQVINALLKNKESRSSDLVVYSDAPRTIEDGTRVAEVRRLLDALDGFRSIRIIKREVNLGLANSIINGVTDLLRESEKIIVVEDDLVLSKYFLAYMNQCLDLYESAPNVASIIGYSYPLDVSLPATFFLKGAACWGWATWKNKWDCFERDAGALLGKFTEESRDEFNHFGNFDYLNMLRLQSMNRIDSWGIRWHASTFLNDLYSLYPQKSYVHNIGMDGSGIHSTKTNAFDTEIRQNCPAVKKTPVSQEIEISIAVGKHLNSALNGR